MHELITPWLHVSKSPCHQQKITPIWVFGGKYEKQIGELTGRESTDWINSLHVLRYLTRGSEKLIRTKLLRGYTNPLEMLCTFSSTRVECLQPSNHGVCPFQYFTVQCSMRRFPSIL